MEMENLVEVPEETLHQLLVQGLRHEVVFKGKDAWFIAISPSDLNYIKVQGLPHEAMQFKPLKVIVRHFPFECIVTYENTLTPYKFVPKLFAGALYSGMPEEVDKLILSKFLETEVGQRVFQVRDITEYIFLRQPIEIELSPSETLYVIKHLLSALFSKKRRARVSGFRELGLEQLAKQYNSSLKISKK